MELNELRKLIKDSSYSNEINELTIILEFRAVDEKYDLKGFYNIYKFFKDENDKWGSIINPEEKRLFRESINFFSSAIKNLDFKVIPLLKDENNNIGRIKSEFKSINNVLNSNPQVYTYSSTTVNFLLKINKRNPNQAISAFDYFVGNHFNITNKDSLIGYLLAYEFSSKENSEIFNRREFEKESLSRLRSEFKTLSQDYENEVINFQKNIEENYKDYKEGIDKFLETTKNDTEEFLKTTKKYSDDWITKNKEKFKEFQKSSEDEIEKLQNQYTELLKLSEPVEYWKERAEFLNKEAKKYFCYMGIIIFIASTSVFSLLWFTPEGMLESIFQGDSTAAIRWSIVFVVFISLVFILFRAVMKYTFSNLHLARDAEEREKLTYLYLSLLSKGDISKEEKGIVFQALFSRSDTGLLKEDSSPTMPGLTGVIERMK